MIFNLGGFLLGFLACNNVFTLLWSLCARPLGGDLDENEPLSWKVKGSQAEQADRCLALMMGDLGYEQVVKKEEGNQAYTPQTYKMSKFYDIWEERTKGMLIPVFEGVDIAGGKPIWVDLTKELHGDRCGSTGNGKSVDLRTLLECLALANSRTPLEVIAIDGKEAELHPYAYEKRVKIDVLFDNEGDQFHHAIKGLYMRMKERMKELRLAKCEKIEQYNDQHKDERMPYVVLVIDEFSRIYKMGETKEDKVYNAQITKYLVELIELGRACGIIIQVTTQNPSCRSIPPSIFAQFTTTKSYRLKRKVDSERVLSDKIAGKWAHQLKGKGLFLYQSPSMSFCGHAPHTELSDAPFYPEYKGLVSPKGKYVQEKQKANAFILSLLQKKEEATVTIDELASLCQLENDRRFKESVLEHVLAEFPHKQAIKTGKKITGYKIFSNQSKQQKNDNNHP